MHVHLGKSRDGGSLTHQEIKQFMDDLELTHVVLFPIDDPEARPTYTSLNARIASIAAKHKEIVAFCRLNPSRLHDAHKELKRITKLGMRGIKLHPRADDFSPHQVEDLMVEIAVMQYLIGAMETMNQQL